MKTAYVFVPLLLAQLALAQSPQTQPAKNLAEMKREVDEIFKLDNVEARAHVKVVFEYAKALAAAHRNAEAIRYYDSALKLAPWAMDQHLAYAQLLESAGRKKDAIKHAKIVLASAEEDELQIAAMKIADPGKSPDLTLAEISKPKTNDVGVVLVPMGKVDVLLLKDLAPKLQKELGVPVTVQKANLEMPPCDREPMKDFLKPLRTQILEGGIGKYKKLLKQLDMTPDDLQDDRNFLHFLRVMLMVTRGKEALKEFDTGSPDSDPQWDARKLVTLLHKTVQPFEIPNVRYVGVTNVDVYTEQHRFLFGFASGGGAVCSYRRFQASFNEEMPDRDRLEDRTLKQCLSSILLNYGIDRCSNPKCARAYPNSVQEHDAKSPHLCDECKQAFQEMVGKANATTPEKK